MAQSYSELISEVRKAIRIVSLEEIRRRQEERVPMILLDVREKDEYRTVRANGAVLMPMSEFQDRAAELPKDRPIYVICASGNRSAAVTGFLLRSGWTDVTNVTGGTGEWERRGLPVNRGEPAPGEGEL